MASQLDTAPRAALRGTSRSVMRVGLGCMGMSEFYGPTDTAEAARTLRQAVEAGVDLFDTADMYGRGANEELVGRALAPVREQVVIATKGGIVRGTTQADMSRNSSPAYIRNACEASLRRLGVETIDLYYLHRLDGTTSVEDSVGELAKLHQEGKVQAIGLSEIDAATLVRAEAVMPVAAVQSEYSLVSRGHEVEQVIDACGSLGAMFVSYSPLGRGLLTGAYDRSHVFGNADYRSIHPRFQGEAFESNLRLVDGLASLARSLDATSAQLAIAWVLARAPHVAAIPGSRSTKRLLQNIAAAQLALTPEQTSQLDQLLPPGAVQGARA